MRPKFIITTTNITCGRIDNGKDKAEAKFGQVAHTHQYLTVVMRMIMRMIMKMTLKMIMKMSMKMMLVVMVLRLLFNNY